MSSLNRHPVYTNLGYSWSFYGLTVVHLLGPVLLGVVTMMVCVFTGLSILIAAAVFLSSSVAVAVFQWRRPATHLEDTVMGLLTPDFLSHVVDDDETWDFPIGREEVTRA